MTLIKYDIVNKCYMISLFSLNALIHCIKRSASIINKKKSFFPSFSHLSFDLLTVMRNSGPATKNALLKKKRFHSEENSLWGMEFA